MICLRSTIQLASPLIFYNVKYEAKCEDLMLGEAIFPRPRSFCWTLSWEEWKNRETKNTHFSPSSTLNLRSTQVDTNSWFIYYARFGPRVHYKPKTFIPWIQSVYGFDLFFLKKWWIGPKVEKGKKK
jgi:hypothetical protein